MMKQIWWIVLAVIVLVGIKLMGFYNDVKIMWPAIDNQYAQVQNMYERRADLIPQLTAVVKKYANYESWTLLAVVQARNEASQNLELLNKMVDEGKVQSVDFNQLVTSTLAGLKIAVEAYPDLKANTQFTSLFTELEGSENRIRVEIKNYNDTVAVFNTKLVTFPNNMLAWIFNFSAKPPITPPADKPIKDVPDVNALLE